jgi:hypothetical protein
MIIETTECLDCIGDLHTAPDTRLDINLGTADSLDKESTSKTIKQDQYHEIIITHSYSKNQDDEIRVKGV